MTKKLVTFDDFSFGEFGLLGEAGAPAGGFTGQNVVRLMDGSLTPRSGLVNLAPTGVPAGNVLGFGRHDTTGKLWFVIGDRVYQFSDAGLGQAVATLSTALSAVPSKRIKSFAESNDDTLITCYGDRSYRLNHTSAAVTALAGSPGGRVLVVHGERLLVASASGAGHRLYYSAAGDFASWPAANYIDIGSGYEVQLLANQREHVLLNKNDGTWWVLTGTPSVNDVLRQVTRGLRPANADNAPTRFGLSGDGLLWFIPADRHYPALFTGSSFRTLKHLRLVPDAYSYPDSGTLPKIGVTGLTEPDEMLFVSGSAGVIPAGDHRALLFRNGMWTFHLFSESLSGLVDGRYNSARRAFFCNGSATPGFYCWSYDLERPPFAGNTFEAIGDASTNPLSAFFTLPEWWAKDSDEVSVVSVTVDFRKYAHGFAAANAFNVVITPLRRDGVGDGTAVTKAWSEASSVPSGGVAGQTDREAFTFPTAWAHGFRVQITGLVGCAVRRIHVNIDTRPGQGPQ